MATEDDTGRINVGRDTLRAELSQLELRIVDRITTELNKKADRSHVEALERDIDSIKSQGSPAVIQVQETVGEHAKAIAAMREQMIAGGHLVDEHKTMKEDVSSLGAWRNRLAGGILVVGFVAGLNSVHVWLGLG